MKKLLSFLCLILLAFVCVFATGCGNKANQDNTKPVAKEDIKIGLICLHDESSTYDKNFIDSMKRALANLGISEKQLEIVTGVPEGQECYDTAALLAKTCNIIFADSFGHEDFMIQAAKKFTNVNFSHATGTKAHTEKLDNYVNAFAAIYEGRYLAGIAAGMKLNEMIASGKITASQAKMGYVGAFPYAEVKSGYTSFYLGAKSVCPTVTMEVRFTSSWYDFDKEKAAAEALINGGCVLISQHADSYGAPEACEKAGVPNVTYNGTTVSQCPNTYVVSSKIDWAPYYEYAIGQTLKGEKIDVDYVGTIASGSVKLDALGTAAAPGTQAAINTAKAALQNGRLHVFDTNTFTVGGKKVTTYLADIDDDGTFTPETEVIKDGYFHESEYRSAPAFDMDIDGITLINE